MTKRHRSGALGRAAAVIALLAVGLAGAVSATGCGGDEGTDVVVTVIRGAHGTPVSAVSIRVLDYQKAVLWQGWSSPDGEARIGGLDREKSYMLAVGEMSPEFCPEVLFEWQPARTVVVLFALARVAGRVLDEEGGPVASAAVSFDFGPGPEYTGVDGRFEMDRVQARGGRLFVEVRSPITGGSRHGEAHVDPPTDAAEVRVVLGAPVRVQLPHAVPTGEAAPVAILSTEDPADGSRWPKRPDEGGRLEFRPVDESASYRLWLHAPGRGYVLMPGLRARGEAYMADFAPGHTVRGRLRAPKGFVAETVEGALPGHFLGVRGSVEPDGTYVRGGIPPGAWVITVSGRKGETSCWGQVTVDVAADTVAHIPIRCEER